jgi:hypothetical protein
LNTGAAHELHPATAAVGRPTLAAARTTKSAERRNRDMGIDLIAGA